MIVASQWLVSGGCYRGCVLGWLLAGGSGCRGGLLWDS